VLDKLRTSTGGAVFWFVLSLVVMAINFRSATRGSWLALLLGLLALVGVITYGRLLLARYRASNDRRQR
jgi:mannose/fructose/N-acetylgalactosamine-specific phosphotransferase system component IID